MSGNSRNRPARTSIPSDRFTGQLCLRTCRYLNSPVRMSLITSASDSGDLNFSEWLPGLDSNQD